jgi:predicted Zn-dependent protease
MVIERPDRLDAWRALARFAETTGQAHLLHEARAWDLLLHGQTKAAQDQWKEAKRTWPADLDARPLDRLESRITQLL